LQQISEELGYPKSTVHRIIQGLIEARYVRDEKGIGLLLGTKMIQLGDKAQLNMPLKEIARPYLQELAQQTRDTVHLGVKDEDEVYYLDKVPGYRPIEFRSRVGDNLPLASTGIGKALMIDMSKMEWRRLIGKQEHFDVPAIIERMEVYSANDYSFDLEDNEELVRCVAVPIRSKYGNIVAAISVTSIQAYMSDDRMFELIEVIRDYSVKISELLN
jgi:DNA-binding IclR family transcriptional regulator